MFENPILDLEIAKINAEKLKREEKPGQLLTSQELVGTIKAARLSVCSQCVGCRFEKKYFGRWLTRIKCRNPQSGYKGQFVSKKVSFEGCSSFLCDSRINTAQTILAIQPYSRPLA